jgi:alanine racemase
MSRIGFACTEDAAKEIGEAANLPGLIPEGLFSHFAMADSKDKSYVNLQAENFRRMQKWIGRDFPICHLHNSAAIVDLAPEFDMVRQGIILYGLQPSDEVDLNRIGGIKPVMSLRSHVSLVKTLPAGTPISYGCTYVTPKESVIATVMAGYADGVPRLLSGCGEVIIRGVKAPIVGRVCMDQFMVDVSHIPGVCAGDTVTIFGTDGNETITADAVAEKAQTIGYELICGIAPRVPRVYLKNGDVDSISRTLPGE